MNLKRKYSGWDKVKNTNIASYIDTAKTIKRAILDSQGHSLLLIAGQHLSLYFGIGLYISTPPPEGYWDTYAIKASSEQK